MEARANELKMHLLEPSWLCTTRVFQNNSSVRLNFAVGEVNAAQQSTQNNCTIVHFVLVWARFSFSYFTITIKMQRLQLCNVCPVNFSKDSHITYHAQIGSNWDKNKLLSPESCSWLVAETRRASRRGKRLKVASENSGISMMERE